MVIEKKDKDALELKFHILVQLALLCILQKTHEIILNLLLIY